MSTASPPSSGSKRFLWIALAAAVVVFAISIPWQKRQWEESARLREQTAAQEKQVAALRDASIASGSKPTSPLQRAQQLLEKGDSKGAEQTLLEAEQHLNANAPAEADLELSDLFQKVGRIDRAYHWAQAAQKKSPDAMETLLRLGYLELLVGHASPAQRAFAAALKHYPKRAEPNSAFALYLNQTEDSDRAAQYLRRALQLQPENWQIRLILVQQLLQRKQFDAALHALEPLRQEPRATRAFWLQTADIYLLRAKAEGRQDGYIAKAADALTTVVKLPNAPTPTELLYRQGQLRLLQDDKTGARVAWEKALALNPAQPKLQYELGRLRIQTGDRTGGLALIKAQEEQNKTGAEYDRLVLSAGAEPQTAAAHRALALWCQAHGKIARARLEWDLVCEFAPGDTQAEQALARLN